MTRHQPHPTDASRSLCGLAKTLGPPDGTPCKRCAAVAAKAAREKQAVAAGLAEATAAAPPMSSLPYVLAVVVAVAYAWTLWEACRALL